IEASESDADDEADEDTVHVEEKEGFMAFINDEEEEEESVEGADDDICSQLSVAWAKMSISHANEPAWQGVVDRAREHARASTSNEAPQGEIVPMFWNIRVMCGKEVAIAMLIGNYAMFSDTWLPIIRSVFARAGIPGYIVVKTNRAEHAWGLCQGFTGVLEGLASVETHDAVRWLTVGPYLPVPGSWVRMTHKFSRLYEGDLGWVYSTNYERQALVLLLPRFDASLSYDQRPIKEKRKRGKGKGKEKEQQEDQEQQQEDKEKGKRCQAPRPPQAMLSFSEAVRLFCQKNIFHPFDVSDDSPIVDDYFQIVLEDDSCLIYHGLLLSTTLDFEFAQPTDGELEFFYSFSAFQWLQKDPD
ncbi:hypothetical protein H0H92_012049, partial [Tricholoma furcatifolium]